jgi:hypothetical protein
VTRAACLWPRSAHVTPTTGAPSFAACPTDTQPIMSESSERRINQSSSPNSPFILKGCNSRGRPQLTFRLAITRTSADPDVSIEAAHLPRAGPCRRSVRCATTQALSQRDGHQRMSSEVGCPRNLSAMCHRRHHELHRAEHRVGMLAVRWALELVLRQRLLDRAGVPGHRPPGFPRRGLGFRRSELDDVPPAGLREDLGDARPLVAVTVNGNQAKGDKDPAEWMPPYGSPHCRYLNAWVADKTRWRLTVDTAEKAALTETRRGARTSPSP